jgi:hypothetical protein
VQIRALDMGYIMGGDLLRAELDAAVAGLGHGDVSAGADGDVGGRDRGRPRSCRWPPSRGSATATRAQARAPMEMCRGGRKGSRAAETLPM